MEMLTHLFYFIISAVCIAIIWMIFILANDLLNRAIESPYWKEFFGTLSTISLFAAIGVVIWQSAISFFIGMVLISMIILVTYFVKQLISRLFSTNA